MAVPFEDIQGVSLGISPFIQPYTGKLIRYHVVKKFIDVCIVRIDGSQHTYKHADSVEIITIIHPARDYAPGTLDKILKQMGLK